MRDKTLVLYINGSSNTTDPYEDWEGYHFDQRPGPTFQPIIAGTTEDYGLVAHTVICDNFNFSWLSCRV